MVKGKKILGTLAMDMQTGKGFGRVRNIVVDPAEKRAKALILPGKRWFYPPVWVDTGSVLSLGRDVLSIDSSTGIHSTKEIPAIREELDKDIRKIWGTMVVTFHGKLVGYLEDIYFTVPGGTVAGLELSRGFIGDVLQGRDFIPAERIRTLSFDSVILEAEE